MGSAGATRPGTVHTGVPMNRFARVATLLTGASLAAGIALATPASATTIKTGFGRIDGNGLDFGTNFDANGNATGDATFTWDLTDGKTKLNVDGQLIARDHSGVAVRLYMYYYKSVDGTGPVFSVDHVAGFTPATDSTTWSNIDWTPAGGKGVQSAYVCTATDADHDGTYTLDHCILSHIG
jgi:hypothetical protein